MPYPNPAKNRMAFMLDLENNADVKIVIFDMAGNKISEIAEYKAQGKNVVINWNCAHVAPGIYLVKTVVNGKVLKTKKIALIK